MHGELTKEQKELVRQYINQNPNSSVSNVACKLGLTRQYVQDYLEKGHKEYVDALTMAEAPALQASGSEHSPVTQSEGE